MLSNFDVLKMQKESLTKFLNQRPGRVQKKRGNGFPAAMCGRPGWNDCTEHAKLMGGTVILVPADTWDSQPVRLDNKLQGCGWHRALHDGWCGGLGCLAMGNT